MHAADRKASKSKEKAADKLRQSRRQVLVEFYKKHVPEKTASDVDAIIAKRQSKGKNWFDELCAKLKASTARTLRMASPPAPGRRRRLRAAAAAAAAAATMMRTRRAVRLHPSAPRVFCLLGCSSRCY